MRNSIGTPAEPLVDFRLGLEPELQVARFAPIVPEQGL
jgi:hypothetical protein